MVKSRSEAPPATPLLSVNPGFLGDKVAQGAVIAAVREAGGAVFGIERADDAFSFVDLAPGVIGAFTLSEAQYREPNGLGEVLVAGARSGMIGRSLAFTTCHTPDSCPAALRSLAMLTGSVAPLWDQLGQLSNRGIWPRVAWSQRAENLARARLTRFGLDIGGYFVLHTRQLGRDPARNLDRSKYLSIAAAAAADFALPCLWIDDGPEIVATPTGVFRVDPRDIDVQEMAILMSFSRAFVGGDSGPLHLAAAAGAFVIATERQDGALGEGYGPFCDSQDGVKLDCASSTPAIILRLLNEVARVSPPPRSEVAAPLPRVRRRSNPDVPFYSSIGEGPSSSKIIDMYCALMSGSGLQGDYIPFRTNDFCEAAAFLDDLGARAFSVGAPFKLAAFKYATSLDSTAKVVGAVNTLVRETDGCGWRGSNTDVFGFEASLRSLGRDSDLSLGSSLVLGSGGAARACAYVLRRLGSKVEVWSRNGQTLGTLCVDLDVHRSSPEELAGRTFDMVVNATGSSVESGQLSNVIRNLRWSSQCAYQDLSLGRTAEWNVAQLRDAGANASDGWAMLLAQGRRQIDLFGLERSGRTSMSPLLVAASEHA